MQNTISFQSLNFTPKNIKGFHSKIKQGQADECWIWQGALDRRNEYGRYDIRRDNKCRHLLAHRIAYYLATGMEPGEFYVCHKCDNPKCCNPAHLFLGTRQDNVDDMVRKQRQAKGERHGSRTKPERLARGDRSGSRLHPERLRRGANHPWNLRPEIRLYGDKNGRRKHPENYPTGDKHYTRQHPEKVARGEDAGRTILTTEQVLEIRRLFEDARHSVSERRVAKQYGVSRSTITAIIKRRNWRHI